MSNILFYVDDSGTRRLDRKPPHPGEPEWFAFGGVLFREEDKSAIEKSHAGFVSQWPIGDSPLHSSDIRGRRGAFAFLNDANEKKEFLDRLEQWLLSLPVLALACVIDRPGYDARFNALYEHRHRWHLCKSAFPIVFDRAAKYAQRQQAKLSLVFEHCHGEDKNIRSYFHDALTNGFPFSGQTSAKYSPLSSEQLRAVVTGKLDFKPKTSRCMQIADLVLHPICRGRYFENHRPLLALRGANKLIDSCCDDPEVEGIKYYCFPKSNKGSDEAEPLAA